MNNSSLGTRLKLRGKITKKTNHSTSDTPGEKEEAALAGKQSEK
jgi:hypothetical protein